MAKRGRPRKGNQSRSPADTSKSSSLKIKTDKEPAALPSDEPLPNIPKKRGRKAKIPVEVKPDISQNAEETLQAETVVKNTESFSVVKDDPIDEENNRSESFNLKLEGDRLSSLRRRKGEPAPVEPEPGPSHKEEPAEFSDASEDHFEDFNLDDSDSDPTWTGRGAKTAEREAAKPPLSVPTPGKKRGGKPVRKPSPKTPQNPVSCSPPPPKKKKPLETRGKEQERLVPSITIVRAKPTVKKDKKEASVPTVKKEASKKEKKKKEGGKKMRKEKEPEIVDRFLIAKADLEQATPYIWKVDKRTHMLQRFEISEQNGALIYQSSFTYAAWNEFSFSHYVTANVEVVSRSPVLHVVKFLGPDPSQPVENVFSTSSIPTSNANNTPVEIPQNSDEDESEEDEEDDDEEVRPVKEDENFDHLKENFDIFLQSLISQAVDSSFLSEISRENDEYFLNNIKEIESVSEAKKEKITREFWEEELLTSANTFPCVNILDSIMEHDHCQVCKKKKGIKLLQFYGQPYDGTTLGSVIMSLSSKTQFFVCAKCASTVSLYNHLHHQKYNFFIKCRTKMNEVRGDREKLESHTLLGDCLEDHNWVNSLFEELVQVWRESERDS